MWARAPVAQNRRRELAEPKNASTAENGGSTRPARRCAFAIFIAESRQMTAQKINRLCGAVVPPLSVAALLTVMTGYFQAPQPDEGTAAHIFQLLIVALVPTILLFLATADWKQPLRNARRLVLPATTLALAFGALYYLEHIYYVHHLR